MWSHTSVGDETGRTILVKTPADYDKGERREREDERMTEVWKTME